jgi:type IV pilus assembly protein PilW
MNQSSSFCMRIQARRQAGLSLIELMIGLTIGLMLTLGLFTLIAGQSTTFKTQDDFARMQENATSALRYIGDSIRMAGFYGFTQDPAAISLTAGAVSTSADCGSSTNYVDGAVSGLLNGTYEAGEEVNWALRTQVAISGWSGLTPASVNGIYPCIRAANFATGPGANPNPILVTRLAGGYSMPDPNADGDFTDGIAAQTNSATTIYIQADPNAGLMFYGANFAALRAAGTTRSTSTGADLPVYEFKAYVYYLRPCSRTATPPSCAATDDNGQPIPTLVRQELVGRAMTEIPLVEGVERIDYRYGIDDQPAVNPVGGGVGDGVPDRFIASPAATDWPNVVSVKVSVLVRSPTITAGYSDAGKTYDLDGDGNSDFACAAGVNCMYKRKVFSQTFQVRNRAQRRGI